VRTRDESQARMRHRRDRRHHISCDGTTPPGHTLQRLCTHPQYLPGHAQPTAGSRPGLFDLPVSRPCHPLSFAVYGSLGVVRAAETAPRRTASCTGCDPIRRRRCGNGRMDLRPTRGCGESPPKVVEARSSLLKTALSSCTDGVSGTSRWLADQRRFLAGRPALPCSPSFPPRKGIRSRLTV
jgi:hypothetical protein